jgi:hypothetical protein
MTYDACQRRFGMTFVLRPINDHSSIRKQCESQVFVHNSKHKLVQERDLIGGQLPGDRREVKTRLFRKRDKAPGDAVGWYPASDTGYPKG